MGMHELGLRKAVLREIELYKTLEQEKATAKQKKLENWDEVCEHLPIIIKH